MVASDKPYPPPGDRAFDLQKKMTASHYIINEFRGHFGDDYRNTKERTKAYNIRLIINTARRGVMRFAQTGTGQGAYLPPDTERPVLLETAFVRDRARQMVSNSGAGPVP
ncbi:hypothetical protein FOVSG1_003728 [Fusarium oxysporum f. sp. vasinfectum]